MADLYASIDTVTPEIQQRLAEVLENRAGDPRQRQMLESYLGRIEFPPGARVLEIGCGTGCVSRTLACWPGVGKVVGIDPSALFIARAKELAAGMAKLAFEIGDGCRLGQSDQSFEVVVLHTTLCHVPEPARMLAEAWRVLCPRGTLAVFDGDYATATVATGPGDPLETCIEAFRGGFVHDPWLVRRLTELLRGSGFQPGSLHSHGYVEAGEGGYLLTWLDRGAEVLLQQGRIDAAEAEAFKAEARRRSERQQWFGHVAFASILGQKPAGASAR